MRAVKLQSRREMGFWKQGAKLFLFVATQSMLQCVSKSERIYVTLLGMIDRSSPRYLAVFWQFAFAWVANGLMCFAFVVGSIATSPTFDEPAHFASGVVLARNADAGYFKVNPPVNKWITAGSSFIAPALEVPNGAASSSFANLMRPEFDLGDKLLELNPDNSYFNAMVIARLARVPFLLFGSWMLWQLTASWPITSRALCQVFWCTSPLLLGHGAIVSADALSGVAMCFILWTTPLLWKNPNWFGFALSGLAWGLAIGTKFTFGPLYLAFPLAVHLCASKGWTSSMVQRPNDSVLEASVSVTRRMMTAGKVWFVHASVACIVVNSLYLFHETAIPIGQHDFIGNTFSSLTKPSASDSVFVKQFKAIIAVVPSPFPRSFLEGVDQQMADMDWPRGAYLLGSRIPGEIHWFFLVGYVMKEQFAVLVAAIVGGMYLLAGLLRRKSRRSLASEVRVDFIHRSAIASSSVLQSAWKHPTDESFRSFCIFFLMIFGLFMATQSNLVWNVRYLIPALPMVYVLVASSLPSIPIRFASKVRHSIQTLDLLPIAIIAIAFVEFFQRSPHHFSYINPLFGGSHRNPIALNDSNFDYGQDLFFARDWVNQYRANLSQSDSATVYGVLSGHGCQWLEGVVEPASTEILRRAIQLKADGASEDRRATSPKESKRNIVLVSRGLFHPEPWAVRYSALGGDPLNEAELVLVRELLLHPPDVWITPAVVGYRIDGR